MTQPTPFGKYLLLERINVGGMAEVFKAKAFGIEGFERTLAIKRILPNMADDEEFINMFIDEARICVQLTHANIVPVFELGRLDTQYYIAMEYVPGRDLRNVLDRFRKRERLLPLAAGAFVTAKICEGLDYAHRKPDASNRPLNLIHRDVSPQNILLSYEGAIKITDFGIAKAEDRASKTQAGVLKGKFAYMSPEQVRGLEIDQRSDIFAVGILLYEMVTGKRLFIGESDFATLEKVRAAQVQPPREHNPDISEDFERVILKALARDRDERYATAAELADDLQPFLIYDNTVFTNKKLGELLHEEYAAEIESERKRNEEYVRLPPPSQRDQQSAEQHRAVKGAQAEWGGGGRPEKTVIFESDFGHATPLATTGNFRTDESVLDAGASERPTLAMDEQSSASFVGKRPATSVQAPRRSGRPFGALVTGVVVVAAAVLAFAWQRFTLSNQTGTLVVTSTPTEQVNVYLDGLLIAQHTPYTLKGVGAGSHRLVVRAPGFRDKAYRFDFDFSQGTNAEIKAELERDAAPVLPGETSLDVTSEPPMASVRLGGLPQGTTPLTLMAPDTSHAILLEVSRDGYLTQTLSVVFAAGERQKHVHVRLVPVGARPSVAGSRPGGQLASLTVRSRPERATVYLGGVRKGVSPMVITDLNPAATYVVEVVRDGYRPFESIVHMKGRTSVDLQADLSGKGGATAASEPVERRVRPSGAGCSGSGGKWSVLAMSVGDCRVTVGKQPLGVAPMFKKDGPVGRCLVEVSCPGGKRFSTTRQMRAGGEEKIIIKASDWQ
jgi:serine/threonine protein kinase